MGMTAENLDALKLARRYVDILGRRKIWVLLPLLVGIIISGFLILSLPNVYRSSTLIIIEAQKVPQSYVQSSVTGTAEGRLSTIRQQILSRSLLQRLGGKYNLFSEGPPTRFQGLLNKLSREWYGEELFRGKSSEEFIAMMRSRIDIKTRGTRGVDSFTVSFEGSDPEVVMNVTSELASLFIEENLKVREQLIEGTSRFLDSELNNVKNALEAQEKKVADFKRRYMGALPSQLPANLAALSRLNLELLSIRGERRASREMRMRLGSIGDALEDLASLAPRQETLGVTENIASPLERELSEMKGKLSALKLEFTEDYPDVQVLEGKIQDVEDQLSHIRIQKDPEPPAQVESLSKPIEEIDGLSDIMGNQLGEVRREDVLLQEKEQEILKRIRGYEERIENVPAREQDLARLTRDYENTMNNYQSLLNKKLNAKISENLEKRQKGEQFHIIDPANFPEEPISPNRLRIGLLGVFLGLGGGIALAFLMEQIDSSYREPEEIEHVTSLTVLATIPDFTEEMLKGKG